MVGKQQGAGVRGADLQHSEAVVHGGELSVARRSLQVRRVLDLGGSIDGNKASQVRLNDQKGGRRDEDDGSQREEVPNHPNLHQLKERLIVGFEHAQ